MEEKLHAQLANGRVAAVSIQGTFHTTTNLNDDEPWDQEALGKVHSYLMSISDNCYRIKHNDAALTSLTLGHYSDEFYFEHVANGDSSDNTAYCVPDIGSNWARLGNDVGNNRCLKSLYFDYGDNSEDENYGPFGPRVTRKDLAEFCSGLKFNRWIESIHIKKCDLFGMELFDYLAPFLETNANLRKITIDNEDDVDYDIGNNALRSISESLPKCTHITKLRFIECDMETEGIRLLSTGIKGCKSLKSLSLVGVNALKETTGIDGEALGHLVEALHGHPELVELTLCRNDLGRNFNFATLIFLLEDSKLKLLNLQDNNIGGAHAAIMACALSNNSSLLTLDLSSNRITSTGWHAFLRLLCDTSSIENTRKANHALQSIGTVHQARRLDTKLLADLSFNLNLNKNRNKGYVAQQKILRHHFTGEFNMGPFVGMELTVIPFLISWIGNIGTNVTYEKDVTRRQSALNCFLKNMPWLLQLQP
mmetsp:Transcript_14955/g.32251  ORF Transcript_14955/g.32251 Transcript_14955/m.32251 type:complete len:479 (-) Transcript_14955:1180-2616(-)